MKPMPNLDYIQILKDLISIDTSVPPGSNYERAIDFLEPLFRQAGLETQKAAIPDEHAGGNRGRFALLAHRRSPGKPRLVFYGHVDVVPAEGWAAFTPREEAGRLYGRGAADMKGGIVALLVGLDAVKGSTPAYDISVMITTDEEVGQAQQIRYLGHFLGPLDGASFFDLDSDFGSVAVASLGSAGMEIRVKGRSVHSALSHLGENAVEKAGLLVAALLDLKNRVEQRQSSVETNPATGLSRMAARLSINMVRGGLKSNIIPDECIIAVDRRLIPEEKLEDAERELLDTLSGVNGVRWEVVNTFRIPTVPPASGQAVDRLADVIRQVTGRSGKYGEMGSGDFGPVAALEWKAVHFGSGVIRTECNIHGRDEFVYLKDVEQLGRIIARFIV